MDALLNVKDTKSLVLLLIVALWTLIWKGLSLWQAGRRNQRTWFVVLLVVSTFGILEIVYLFFILKMKPSELFKGSSDTGKSSDEQK